MSAHLVRRYTVTCGLLLLPILAGNVAFVGRLPPAISDPALWGAIPQSLALAENLLRALVFGLPFVMPLDVSTRRQRIGLVVVVLGMLVYAASWLVLIAAPQSHWSVSAAGFLAPAYTPALWLLGIALLGKEYSWGASCPPWVYASIALAFLAAHVSHAGIVYANTIAPRA